MIYKNLSYLCDMKNVIKIIIIAIVIAIAFFLSSCKKVEQPIVQKIEQIDSTYLIEYDTFLGKNIYNLKEPVKDSNWYYISKRVGSYHLRYILLNVYWNDVYPNLPIKLKQHTTLQYFKENNNYNLKKLHNYKNCIPLIIYAEKYTYIDDYIYPYNTYGNPTLYVDFRVKK